MAILLPAYALCADAPASSSSNTPAAKTIKRNKPVHKTGARKRHPIKKMKEAAKPVEAAVSKTAVTAVKEAQVVAKEVHSLGGKLLQGLINIMIAASPGNTRVYLPAPSSDPNSGLTVGVLPVFLFVDKKDEIRHIIAPSVTYNRLFKVNTTMRYYWYPKKGAQLFTLAAYAVETNRRAVFRYEDPEFLFKWLYVKLDLNFLQDGSYRFFGFGPDSQESNQYNYTIRDDHMQMSAGVNFLEYFRFIISHRLRYVNVVDGPITSLKMISNFDPRPEGVYNHKRIAAQRFAVQYDSRDLPVTPLKGHYFSAFFEQSGPFLGSDVKFERAGTDLRGFYPVKNNRYVTGWRFLAEGETGDGTPFYEQSFLGGKDSLRGFGDARFVDRDKISFSLEERIRMYTLQAFNANIDFELAPFYETGTVFHSASSLKKGDMHNVFGVGFRSIVRPNVVGIIDLGFSEDGTALFVGIDYPF